MDELNPTIKERQIYHEMKLTPAMVKSIRTLCGVCLRHYVETKRQDCHCAEQGQMHGNLHGLPDPAWLRLRCHAALNPVFIRPQGCDRITKINYHHELSKSPLPKRSGFCISEWRFAFGIELEVPTRRHLFCKTGGRRWLRTKRCPSSSYSSK